MGRLASEAAFDYLVIESTGISEPQQVHVLPSPSRFDLFSLVSLSAMLLQAAVRGAAAPPVVDCHGLRCKNPSAPHDRQHRTQQVAETFELPSSEGTAPLKEAS